MSPGNGGGWQQSLLLVAASLLPCIAVEAKQQHGQAQATLQLQLGDSCSPN